MRIAEYYSHLNGYEFIKVHKPGLWSEIEKVIAEVDVRKYRTKVSKEKTMKGELLLSPRQLNEAVDAGFSKRGWKQRTASYWVTKDAKLIRKTLNMSPDEQRAEILAAGQEATRSFNQTDFVKDRVAVEVQFGKYFAVAYDLFVKHLAFYVGDVIDVGVEIVPMKSLSASTLRDSGKRVRNMSTGIAWYEKELYNLIREGRGVPGVPLVLIGVAA
ncbi:MAG TPA: BglII/BstYI family type II restriction endonuclease [Rhizomicrobium sp.]|nr:BglII/BstYI family type II restriction endonuclease [Rhizomicrobium sp.]